MTPMNFLGGVKQGRGRGRLRGRGRGRGGARPNKDALDKELDSYMASSKAEPI